MSHKTLISGTAYEVVGGAQMIDGTKFQMGGGKTLVGGTAFTIPFSSGIPIGTLPVGSVVKIGVNGKSYDFLVVNQGIPSNSSLYDSSCDGTWLLMRDIYENRQWSVINSNVLENSTIQSYLNSTFLNLIDSDVGGAIKQVKIPYRKDGNGGPNQSGANGLSCKILLLSGYEVGWTTNDNRYFPVDGAKLSYFETGNGGYAQSKRIANLGGAATEWWLRSPYTISGYVWSVRNSGQYGDWPEPVQRLGVRPAFTIPATFPVIQNPDGTYSPAA